MVQSRFDRMHHKGDISHLWLWKYKIKKSAAFWMISGSLINFGSLEHKLFSPVYQDTLNWVVTFVLKRFLTSFSLTQWSQHVAWVAHSEQWTLILEDKSCELVFLIIEAFQLSPKNYIIICSLHFPLCAVLGNNSLSWGYTIDYLGSVSLF